MKFDPLTIAQWQHVATSDSQLIMQGKKVVAEVCNDEGFDDSFTVAESEQHAKLIEHAPDLFRALYNLVEDTERWNRAVEDIIGKQPRTNINLDLAKELMEEIRGK